jgi:hypothetical protein
VIYPRFQKSISENNFHFLDETNYADLRIDIVLPAKESIENVKELNDALKTYDLEITLVEREVEFLVFKEKAFNFESKNYKLKLAAQSLGPVK